MPTYRADEWQSVRERGKAAYLFRYGFLSRLPLGIVAAVAIEAAFGNALPDALWSAPFLARLVACVAVFTLSGCLRASLTWNAFEKRFDQHA